MASSEQTEKKKMNPIVWFLFAVVIPLLIVGTIVIVGLNIAGFNVIDWAKEKGSTMPVISNFVSSPEEEATAEDVERLTEQLAEKNEELEELDLYVDDLEATIGDLEQELSRHEQIVERYESVYTADVDGESLEEGEETEGEALNDVAKSFEEMKPANAATILGGMEDSEILRLLRELPNDVRGEILEAMETELAARITTQLMDE